MSFSAGFGQIAWIGDAIGDWFNDLYNKFISLMTTPFAMILYGLQTGFFYIVDMVQAVFRKMAGLDSYYYQGNVTDGDPIIALLMDQTVINILIAVLVVSIMLLFFTTFIAILRTEFTQNNAKGPIFGKAVKAIAYFFIVPTVCVMGIFVSNIFLRSFDKATNRAESSELSTTIFFAAGHESNRLRQGNEDLKNLLTGTSEQSVALRNALGIDVNDSLSTMADKVDYAFLRETELGITSIDYGPGYMWLMNKLSPLQNLSTFNHYHMNLTFMFYDLFLGYNYLIGFVGGFMAAALLLSACLGLIQRLYELTILFIISPGFIAFMPIDDGAKYNSWKGEFIRRVGMAYGPIIGLNLFFIVLGRIQEIDIFAPGDFGGLGGFFNVIMHMIFMIVGLLSIKEISSMISGLVGADDAAAKGESKKQGVQDMAGRMATGSIAAAQMGKEGIRAAGKSAVKSVKNLLGEGAEDRRNVKAAKRTRDTDKSNLRKQLDRDKKAIKNDPSLSKDEKRAKLEQLQEAHETQVKNIDKQYDTSTAEARARMDRRAEGSLGDQFKKIRSGDAGSTGIGRNYLNFAKAAGPTFQRYLTSEGIKKANSEGKGFIGALDIYRDGAGNLTDLTSASGAKKKQGEKEKARKDEKNATYNRLDDERAYANDASRNPYLNYQDPSFRQVGSNFYGNPTGQQIPVTGGGGGNALASGGPGGSGGAGGSGGTGGSDFKDFAMNVAISKNSSDYIKQLKAEKAELNELETEKGWLDNAKLLKNGEYSVKKRKEDGSGYEQEHISAEEYKKRVNENKKAMSQQKFVKEDKRLDVEGYRKFIKEQEDAYYNSGLNGEYNDFKAMADMIAQAIAKSELKTKATFDNPPSVRLESGSKVSVNDGKVALDSKTVSDISSAIKELEKAISSIGVPKEETWFGAIKEMTSH